MFLLRGLPNITLSEDMLSPELFIILLLFLPEFQTATSLGFFMGGEWMLKIQLQVFVWLLALRRILAWNTALTEQA